MQFSGIDFSNFVNLAVMLHLILVLLLNLYEYISYTLN